MLTVSDVSLRFSDRKLFDDVNIAFKPGNTYGLIGANGAGKSTFLKILAGDIEPTTGHISLGPDERLSVLRQNHFDYEDERVIDVVIMGNERLYDIMKEKDALYEKEDFSDEDGIKAAELEAEFAEMDGWEADSNASKLMQGLGLDESIMYSQMADLGGNEKVKVLLAQALFGDPDIILLDLGLPDMDGLDVISSVRSWSLCPIIVLSARTTDNDKVSSLDLGADDYITKPFSTNELLARIRTSLRHSNRVVTNDSVSEKPYAALGLKIDFMKRIITRDGEPIHLTPVEYKIVAYIAKNSGKVITYSSILKNVWGPNMDENDNKILRVNMANIRRKIEPNPAEPTYILTELGVGYRMLEDSSL